MEDLNYDSSNKKEKGNVTKLQEFLDKYDIFITTS